MRTLSIWFVAVGLVVGLASRVEAAALASPWISANGTDFLACVATNIGTGNAEAIAELKDMAGTVQTPTGSSCIGPLAAGASCLNQYGPGVDGYCVIAAKGKIRAALVLYDGSNNVKVVVPATK